MENALELETSGWLFVVFQVTLIFYTYQILLRRLQFTIPLIKLLESQNNEHFQCKLMSPHSITKSISMKSFSYRCQFISSFFRIEWRGTFCWEVLFQWWYRLFGYQGFLSIEFFGHQIWLLFQFKLFWMLFFFEFFDGGSNRILKSFLVHNSQNLVRLEFEIFVSDLIFIIMRSVWWFWAFWPLSQYIEKSN
jgi:hypothetical protein